MVRDEEWVAAGEFVLKKSSAWGGRGGVWRWRTRFGDFGEWQHLDLRNNWRTGARSGTGYGI